MNKTDIIARRVLGWKLNRWDRWYDFENGTFIENADFQPEENLDHAMIIVKKLESFGFTYKATTYESIGDHVVCFNDTCAHGTTLAQAITNAAFEIAEVKSIEEGWL